MREAAAPLAASFGWAVEEIDVDCDPVLDRRWGDSVPALLAGERELCHHRFDRAKVMAFLLEGADPKSR